MKTIARSSARPNRYPWLLALREGDLEAAGQVRRDVVDERAHRGQRAEQHDVHRADDGRYAEHAARADQRLAAATVGRLEDLARDAVQLVPDAHAVEDRV